MVCGSICVMLKLVGYYFDHSSQETSINCDEAVWTTQSKEGAGNQISIIF